MTVTQEIHSLMTKWGFMKKNEDGFAWTKPLLEKILKDELDIKFMYDLLEVHKKFENWIERDLFNEYSIEYGTSKTKAQHYTPTCLTKLVNEIAQEKEKTSFYEPSGGTGNMLISAFIKTRQNSNPFNYDNNKYFYHSNDLDTNNVVCCLLNFALRGMSGVVSNYNTLELTSETGIVASTINFNNDSMSISSIFVSKVDYSYDKLLEIMQNRNNEEYFNLVNDKEPKQIELF